MPKAKKAAPKATIGGLKRVKAKAKPKVWTVPKDRSRGAGGPDGRVPI